MAAINYNFPIEKGSSFDIEFNYLDSNNNSIDLTNWCVFMQIIDDANNTYSLSNRDNNNQYKLTTSSDGKISLQLSSTFTSALNFITANYDLDIQEPHEQYSGSGLKTYRILFGEISLTQRNTPVISNICSFMAPSEECAKSCLISDIFSKQYIGSGLIINDMTDNQSSPLNITDTDLIQALSVSINNLNHTSPQDLVFILTPPSGDSVLLAANQKISRYTNNFNFTLSDDQNIPVLLNNVMNDGICKIMDKTEYISYNNPLSYNFSHLLSSSPSGDWYLNILDNDIGGSGSIGSWKLNILYQDQEI
jgi:subtilisin-like proprotein convertase family protein